MAFDATWGGSAATSYISLEDANTYVDESIIEDEGWVAANNDRRRSALAQASRDIDSLNFVGSRFFSEQSLEFPRAFTATPGYSAELAEEDFGDDFQVRSKRDVQAATCIQAAFLLSRRYKTQRTHPLNIAAGVRQFSNSVGPIREQYTYSSSGSILDIYVTRIMQRYTVGRYCVRG